MNVRYAPAFLHDLLSLPPKVRERVAALVLDAAPLCQTTRDLPGCKPVYGHLNLYRIRMGDFRIAFRHEDDGAVFLRALKREEIQLPLGN